MSNASNLAHISQSLLHSWDMTLLDASVLLMSCFMKVLYLLYRFRLMAFPKSKPIHNHFTNCAPFPSISNPYPFPYGFLLHWRALVASQAWPYYSPCYRHDLAACGLSVSVSRAQSRTFSTLRRTSSAHGRTMPLFARQGLLHAWLTNRQCESHTVVSAWVSKPLWEVLAGMEDPSYKGLLLLYLIIYIYRRANYKTIVSSTLAFSGWGTTQLPTLHPGICHVWLLYGAVTSCRCRPDRYSVSIDRATVALYTDGLPSVSVKFSMVWLLVVTGGPRGHLGPPPKT